MKQSLYDAAAVEKTMERIIHRTFGMDMEWDWPAGVAMYGVACAWEATGRADYLQLLRGWMDERLEEGLPPLSVNGVSVGHALLSLYAATGEERYLTIVEQLAEFLAQEAERFDGGVIQHTVSEGYLFPQQAWVDTMMMAGYFLLRAGRVLGREELVEDGLLQYHAHERLLQDERTNLYYHGWDDIGQSHMSAVFWARGNAWAALTMAKALPLIPVQHPSFMRINDSLRDQAAALVRLQAENGLWHTVLDDAGSYTEASASAGIGAALLARGTLYRKQAAKTLRGLLGCIDDEGRVTSVSAGTAVMQDKDGYSRVPCQRIQGWGQGLALVFLADVLRDAQQVSSRGG